MRDFDINNRKFNWVAMIFPGYWLAYYRCYLGLLIFAIGSGVVSSVVCGVFPPIAAVFWIVQWVVCGLWGEEYKRVMVDMKRESLESKGMSSLDIEKRLAPSWTPVCILVGISIVLFVLVCILFASLFAIMFAGAMSS